MGDILIRRIVTFVLISLLVAPVLYFLFVGYKPQLLLNPITRFLYPQREAGHGSKISLVPDIFEKGDAKEEVLRLIHEAGFESWTLSDWDRDVGIDYVFRIGAGGNIACGYEFFVCLDFDDNGKLLLAESKRDGACL